MKTQERGSLSAVTLPYGRCDYHVHDGSAVGGGLWLEVVREQIMLGCCRLEETPAYALRMLEEGRPGAQVDSFPEDSLRRDGGSILGLVRP